MPSHEIYPYKISPRHFGALQHIQVMRIKEMIIKGELSSFLNKSPK